jgi:mono/diheme cytochrome c family protein
MTISLTRLRALHGRPVRAAVLGLSVLPLGACEWFTDFKRQPSVVTWERLDSAGVRGNPQTSVPITGSAVPGFAVSYSNSMQTIDSMSTLANPTPPDSASLANGRKYFMINCAVCHGVAGKGDGTAVKYGVFPFPLVSGPALSRTDGYIFGMIRNGRGNMPPYNRIEEKDRWDVVNYVRGLQGKLSAPVLTGQLAVPGFTGPALPGATTMGPTRPVPHTAAEMQAITGASSPAPAATDTTRRPGTDTTRAGARPTPRQGDRE